MVNHKNEILFDFKFVKKEVKEKSVQNYIGTAFWLQSHEVKLYV
jgi:hypothetical protein